VKAKIIHKSNTSKGTPFDSKNYVRLYYSATQYFELDNSDVKVTQTFTVPGAVVPGFLRHEIACENGESLSGEVFEVWLEIEAESTSSDPAAGIGASGGTVSTAVVDRFHADVKGYKDPDGNYGGLGVLIERPDYVIKHFLVERLGFASGDIDATSFSSAGTSYGTGGYAFGFAVDREIEPSALRQRLAFESRSTLRYRAGTWYLDYIPDTAPSAVKTIRKEDLAGKKAKFVFQRTPVVDLANDLEVRYKRHYSRVGSESEWDATASASDAASKTKYGTYPLELEFHLVRESTTADDVLSHILTQRKAPLLVVTFPVLYEHFDLKAGDTVEIDNDLWDGKKFSIEKIRRTDRFRATVTAIEWWG
jgi:hypothetical protein